MSWLVLEFNIQQQYTALQYPTAILCMPYRVLRSAVRFIGGVPKYAPVSGYMHWLPIQQRIIYRVVVLV